MKCQVLFDWLSFSVLSTDDPQKVITDILKLDADIFDELGYGRNGYRNCLHYDHISVYYNGREGTEKNGGGNEFMGVCVSMSGSGCRTYEQLGGNVLDLAIDVYRTDGVNLTRLDVACDDKDGAFDMDELIRYYNEKRIRSGCRKRQIVQCNDGEYAPARTIYIGSRKSDLCFRFYDKAKEHFDPKDDPDGYNSHWIRVEMQARHEVAENIIQHIYTGLLESRSIGESVAEILGGHIQMIELDDSNISRCSISRWWLDFLETVKGVKVTAKEEKEHIFERKLRWFYNSIVPLASALVSGIGERNMLELMQMGYTRRSKAQDTMLKTYKGFGIHDLGEKVSKKIMHRLYEQWKRRIGLTDCGLLDDVPLPA
ncbi:MAG: replication initiation factor domain-containing protein [Oscillospiraceae bacterium]|nr:replication initiation factor domain-containing protein [Oscillospiraceae bacterium]